MQLLVTATMETSRVQFYAVSQRDSVPFTAKVQKARTRRGKEYYVLRVTIPKDVQRKLHLHPNDHLFFQAEQAKWYHLIDWSRMPETVERLPPELRAVIQSARLLPAAWNDPMTFPRPSGTRDLPQVVMVNPQVESRALVGPAEA